jgi:hypothetical protein
LTKALFLNILPSNDNLNESVTGKNESMNAHTTVQFVLDDFTQPPLPPPEVRQPWEKPKTYYCEAIEGQVKAIMNFRWYSGDSPAPEGYVMALFTSRVNEAYGNMGKRQHAQAQALFPVLEERVHAGLLAAGWRIIGRNRMGDKDVWRPFGGTIQALEEQLHHFASRIWHGSYPRQGTIKFAPLGDETLLQFPTDRWAPIGTDLEAFIDSRKKQILVRRQKRISQDQERPVKSQVVAVIGSKEARAQGATPAFHRTRTTREITFTCAWCTKIVTQERYPSPKPMYCGDTCEQEAQREKTRARVQRFRERRDASAKNISE